MATLFDYAWYSTRKFIYMFRAWRVASRASELKQMYGGTPDLHRRLQGLYTWED